MMMQEHGGTREHGRVETGRKVSYQEALEWEAQEGETVQLVDGVLFVTSRPGAPHTKAGSRLGIKLGGAFDRDEPGGWWILDEPALNCSGNLLVPDLAGWRKERAPEVPMEQPFELRPDWVCEILSPSTRHLDLGRKPLIYAKEGIPWLWIVDPDVQTLDTFALQDGAWQHLANLAGNEQVSAPPFETFSFPLGDLWMRLQLARPGHTIHEPAASYVVGRKAGG